MDQFSSIENILTPPVSHVHEDDSSISMADFETSSPVGGWMCVIA
jgi:hypothetical protein